MSTVAIVILGIAAVIIALVLIILLTPITYSIDIDGRTPYRGELRIKWLWCIFSLHLAYVQGKPFFKELYFLGMLKIGPVKDYEEWLENRVDEEYQKAMMDDDAEMSRAEAFAKAMNGNGEGPVKGSSGVRFDDLDNGSEASGAAENKKVPSSDAVKPDSTRTERTEHIDTSRDKGAQARADRYDSIQRNPTAHLQDDDEVVSRVTFNSDGSVKEKIFTKVNDLKMTVTERFKKPDPDDPVASFQSEIPTFWFMKHVTNMELWRQLLLVSRRCYNHSKPRDMGIEGRFGLGNPYRMGLMASMLYSIWPEQAEQIELDYVNFTCAGSGYIKGRIILGVLAWHGTRFILSKPVRALLGESIRVFLMKRKESKQLEKLKARQASQLS